MFALHDAEDRLAEQSETFAELLKDEETSLADVRQAMDDSAPFAEVLGVQQGSTVDDDGVGPDVYTKLVLTHALAIDRQNYIYTLRVKGPDSPGAGDYLHAARVRFDQTSPEGGF